MFVEFGDYNSSYVHTVIAKRVVRLSKSESGEITFVHLDNGEILESDDGMKTISAKVKAIIREETHER